MKKGKRRNKAEREKGKAVSGPTRSEKNSLRISETELQREDERETKE